MTLKWCTQRKGAAAKGCKDRPKSYPKVAGYWRPDQLEAINRRVVKNNTNFAHEARRLVDIGLQQDHVT